MADFHRCLDCEFAEWKRTKSGALHPSGDGLCRWQYKPPVIATAYSWSGVYGAVHKQSPTPSGGFINRREPIVGCPVFQRRKAE